MHDPDEIDEPQGMPRPAEPQGAPYWETKSLNSMSRAEWEALCDGCGLCCMLKVEDEDTSCVYLTRLACRLLDIGSCRCSDYDNRRSRVRDCVVINPDNLAQFSWLPATCAYRLVAEGSELPWWHHLVSGDAETVHLAGISARGWARTEKGVRKNAITGYIIGETR